MLHGCNSVLFACIGIYIGDFGLNSVSYQIKTCGIGHPVPHPYRSVCVIKKVSPV